MLVVTYENETQYAMKFYYDAEGRPIYLTYRGATYFYVTNLQGDVVGLANNDYGVTITYEYDAWGRPLGSGAVASFDYEIMNLNPLRYRGYIYDAETGFYYLQSRYYDPAVGRFINSDVLVSTGQGFVGYNMFAYCNNNPVMFSDPSGELSKLALALILSGVSGAISGGIAGGIGYFFEGKEFSWKGFGASVLGGAASGAISGIVTTAMILEGYTHPLLHFGVGAGASIIGSIIEYKLTGKRDIVGSLWEALWGGAGSVVGIITTTPGAGAAIGKEMAKILKKPLGKVISLSVQKIGQDVVEESISGFTQWYAQSGVEYFIKNLINSIFGEEEEETA